ncbi:unnamed protein product [Brassica oleracea var. botrytis]
MANSATSPEPKEGKANNIMCLTRTPAQMSLNFIIYDGVTGVFSIIMYD